MRSFGAWKSQVVVWLMKLECKNEQMKQQRDHLIMKLDNLRSRWLASFLTRLHAFCQYWKVEIPGDLLPTKEEILNWRE